MNVLFEIKLVQYRNYAQAAFSFPAPVTCITGPNGSGKTNLLDAAYYLCYTKSYFTGQQQQCIRLGDNGFRIEGRMSFDGEPETIVCKWKDGLKEIIRDGAPYERVTDYIGRHSAVMIAPDDLELINGGSELRRRWMDAVLGQTDREYLERLLTYQRILLQRKAWLRQQAISANADAVSLEYYDAQLAEHGSFIYRQRRAFLEQFAPLLERHYRQLSSGSESVSIDYQSQLSAGDFLAQLRAGLSADVRAQRNLTGIHRDELLLSLNGQLLRNFGSQGQKKSFLFALKLAQYAYLSISLGHLPMLLLDDVFEKLDQQRMEALLRIIRGPGFGQVIITDTHPERVKAAFGEGVMVGMISLERL